ncbi:hypothetical protein THRCLA_08675 [Thraustotheca clavata]|uniref:Uncharacterized protein n=1 Tax=Thraustotheca clavata TaxID=74557 RepID=A0A1V9Z3H8_9STRA|nr:hypothetical protein THRCLA_08675 [Thraustotheca clavata]
MALTSSVSWEKVNHLSPQDEIQMQLETEQKLLVDAVANVERNARGIDMVENKATGVWSITVLSAEELNFNSVLDLSDATTVVASLVIASNAIEKNNPRQFKTNEVRVNRLAKRAIWFKQDQSPIAFTGIKTKAASATLTLYHPSPLIADAFMGTCRLEVSDELLDQQDHTLWLDLQGQPGVSDNESFGKVQVSMRFEYDVVARLQRSVEALATTKAQLDAEVQVFNATAPLVQADSRHPAAFGEQAQRSTVYIPGHRFFPESYHPAAVARTPIADGAKVMTPFGAGTVVTFREVTKMYVVLMEASPGMKKRTTTAYLRTDSVWEAPPPSPFRVNASVSTPYGKGIITAVRSYEHIVVVKTDFGTMYLQEKDVTVDALTPATMSNHERIETAVECSSNGNSLFKDSSLTEAVDKYLESLQYLNKVDQDSASHKEKATVLQTMIRCHLNIGACKLKLGEYADAWTACTNALSILEVIAQNKHGKVAEWMGRLGMTESQIYLEWPSKARFRRATALVAMGNDAEAKQDLMVAVKLMPKDKACRSLLESVSKRLNEAKEKEKQAWGGFLLEQNSTRKGETTTTTTREVKPVATRDLPKKDDSGVFSGRSLLVAASILGVAAVAAVALSKRK